MLDSRDTAAMPGQARPLLFVSILALLIAGGSLTPGQAVDDPARPPAGVEGAWWARVRSDIQASEYQVNWQGSTSLPGLAGAWHAVNRAQGFRAYFTLRGIRVVPRTKDQPAWEWSLSFVGYGRGARRCALGEARLGPRENRIEYDRGAVTEWFVNDPRGLEQGFEIPEPPEDADCLLGGAADLPEEEAERLPLHLDLALSGDLTPVVSADGQAVDFRSGGRAVVHYAQLVVRDARGAQLPARMEGFAAAGQRGIRIVVDDEGAVYPVTVDPLATNPAWTVYGGQGFAHFGYSIDTAGDVNGDGYSDVIVGAPDYDNGEEEEGRAYVYYGSPGGPSLDPAWVEESDHEENRFGAAVATAGDVNGDGYADVVVGAPGGDLAGYAGQAQCVPRLADRALLRHARAVRRRQRGRRRVGLGSRRRQRRRLRRRDRGREPAPDDCTREGVPSSTTAPRRAPSFPRPGRSTATRTGLASGVRSPPPETSTATATPT